MSAGGYYITGMIKLTHGHNLAWFVLTANAVSLVADARSLAADPIRAKMSELIPAITASSSATYIAMPPRMAVFGNPS